MLRCKSSDRKKGRFIYLYPSENNLPTALSGFRGLAYLSEYLTSSNHKSNPKMWGIIDFFGRQELSILQMMAARKD
jgi:hypothetical protein